jgi:hypothetical protein
MTQLRDEAEALAVALEMGICAVDEAIEWSDAWIIHEDAPPFSLCEVSLSRDRYPQDVAALLRQIPGTPLRSNVSALLIILLRRKLTDHPERARDVAYWLYSSACDDAIVDPSLRRFGGEVFDALALAELGYLQESREQIVTNMVSELEQAADKATVTWSVPLRQCPPGHSQREKTLRGRMILAPQRRMTYVLSTMPRC